VTFLQVLPFFFSYERVPLASVLSSVFPVMGFKSCDLPVSFPSIYGNPAFLFHVW